MRNTSQIPCCLVISPGFCGAEWTRGCSVSLIGFGWVPHASTHACTQAHARNACTHVRTHVHYGGDAGDAEEELLVKQGLPSLFELESTQRSWVVVLPNVVQHVANRTCCVTCAPLFKHVFWSRFPFFCAISDLGSSPTLHFSQALHV